MPFKEVERVIYQKNPLIEVVCQLRFPRILSINEKAPAEFQDRIRDLYPLLEEQTEQEQQFTFDAIPGEMPPVPRFVQAESNKNYKFSNEDNTWHINLTSRFIALSTSRYKKWEEFKDHLAVPYRALLEIYHPIFFERVGLRYINAINRNCLGITDIPWRELVNPFALGMLSNPDICDDIKGYSSTTELAIDEGMLARISTALGYVNGVPGELGKSLSFIVDSDMYYGKKGVDEVSIALESLHGASSKLLRALITDNLHNIMEPEKV